MIIKPLILTPCRVFSTLIILVFVFNISGVYESFGFYALNITSIIIFLVSIALFLKNNRTNSIQLLIFFIYVLIVLLSIYNHPETYVKAILHLVLVSTFLFILPELVINRNDFARILKLFVHIIMFVIALNALLNIDNFLSLGFFFNKRDYRLVLSTPNLIGILYFIGFAFSLILYLLEKSRYYIYCLIFYCLFFIFSPLVLTTFIAFFVFFSVYLFFTVRLFSKVVVFLFSGGFLLIYFNYVKSFLTGNDIELTTFTSLRDLALDKSFMLIKENSAFGYGIDNWGFLVNEIIHPHNFLVYVVLSFGFLAAPFYLLILINSTLFFRLKNNGVVQRGGKASTLNSVKLSLFITILAIMMSFAAMPGYFNGISFVISLSLTLTIISIRRQY